MTSSYLNAPATLLLATHCACCGRALVDAKSVEVGVGPDCREKYGYDLPVSDEARTEANKLIHGVALAPTESGAALLRLFELGFTKLVAQLVKRTGGIVVTLIPGGYAVKAPYSEESVGILRGVPGRRWDPAAKVNVFPAAAKRALWVALSRAYPGAAGLGPKGPFVVTAA